MARRLCRSVILSLSTPVARPTKTTHRQEPGQVHAQHVGLDQNVEIILLQADDKTKQQRNGQQNEREAQSSVASPVHGFVAVEYLFV